MTYYTKVKLEFFFLPLAHLYSWCILSLALVTISRFLRRFYTKVKLFCSHIFILILFSISETLHSSKYKLQDHVRLYFYTKTANEGQKSRLSKETNSLLYVDFWIRLSKWWNNLFPKERGRKCQPTHPPVSREKKKANQGGYAHSSCEDVQGHPFVWYIIHQWQICKLSLIKSF